MTSLVLSSGASRTDLYASVETGLRQEFSKLKNERMLRPELRASVKGYIFDIKTGEVKLALE